MKSQALSIYNSHLAIILHHFPDAPKYQQHTAAKKAAVREVEQIVKEKQDCSIYECYGTPISDWQSILTELHKL